MNAAVRVPPRTGLLTGVELEPPLLLCRTPQADSPPTMPPRQRHRTKDLAPRQRLLKQRPLVLVLAATAVDLVILGIAPFRQSLEIGRVGAPSPPRHDDVRDANHCIRPSKQWIRNF